MDQGYQMFSHFYIQPIKRVGEMLAREAYRAAGWVTRGVIKEGVNGIKFAGKEAYKVLVTGRYELRQLEKKKRLALDIEAEYAQRRCETYVDKFDKHIFPKFREAGVSPKVCFSIRNQWLDLSAPDLNPYATLLDYATLQKGYEVLSKAALSGDRLIIEEGIKNWNALIKARMQLKGREEEMFKQGRGTDKEEREGKEGHKNKEEKTEDKGKDGEKTKDTEKKDKAKDEKRKGDPGRTGKNANKRDRKDDRSQWKDNKTDGREKTGRKKEGKRNKGVDNHNKKRQDKVRQPVRGDRVTPDEARRMRTKAARPKEGPDKALKEAAARAERQLRREEKRQIITLTEPDKEKY